MLSGLLDVFSETTLLYFDSLKGCRTSLCYISSILNAGFTFCILFEQFVTINHILLHQEWFVIGLGL